MAKKVQLECTRTNGRWNKGDKAGFEHETAAKMLKAKNAAWKSTAAAAKPAGGAGEGGGAAS
ncbi:hypothetical protein TG4357_03736 [Thalassovita gelatinovora]|uniref:Uncharacterized protein n=1 Tax=Thalassovita gelatinovora TaxID=53501 RepID=A0A0N7LWC1_THAGE|nr:hypothetical protein [Thalassovita gelatinovora]QIZ79070.1 hypothetical protein HFZ77_00555 [Thalassovita gelatinovora]CUH68682.1 hypothetical protein TG4357_03736 [Thalassovita gelatinovora]SEQ56650.1 hypothetical protein SAMN04488043_106197 [Thalassovita gelatinovora]